MIPEILFNKKKKKKNNEPNLFSIILGNEILDTKVYFGTYKMENKIHIVGTIPKSNIKNAERSTINIPNRSLS